MGCIIALTAVRPVTTSRKTRSSPVLGNRGEHHIEEAEEFSLEASQPQETLAARFQGSKWRLPNSLPSSLERHLDQMAVSRNASAAKVFLLRAAFVSHDVPICRE